MCHRQEVHEYWGDEEDTFQSLPRMSSLGSLLQERPSKSSESQQQTLFFPLQKGDTGSQEAGDHGSGRIHCLFIS